MGKKSSLSKPGSGQALTTWIPANAFSPLDELAAERKVSRSTLARQILLSFLATSHKETPVS